jgi:hypothetical protein
MGPALTPHLGYFASVEPVATIPQTGHTGCRGQADISGMEPALSSAPTGAPETHHVLRDGSLVAVLKTVDSGGIFTVVAELREEAGGDNAVRLRQYTFARLEEASAFLAEAASSFAFLGCEIQRA